MVSVRLGSQASSRPRAASGRLKVSLILGIGAFSAFILAVGLTIATYKRTRDQAGPLENGPSVRKVEQASPKIQTSKENTITIAFAVSVTGCGSDPITEGAAVLKHSIHRASVRGKGAGVNDDVKGRYDYEMFAIYHPDAKECAAPLEKLGYKLMERNVFVNVDDIKGDFLRERIRDNGCCGEKELIKLEAYTLTDYPIVVHLDLDVLVLKPLDELFDMMLHKTHMKPGATVSNAIMWPEKPLPENINAFYTYDYNMVAPHKAKPVQGGFLVLRPDKSVYEEFRSIVLEGDFQQGGGWGGVVGPFHGSMTFQGIVPYFYDFLHPGQSVELNRCIYNQMCDNPRDKKTVNDVVNGKCRTGEEECEDCRSRPLEDVVTVHFTLCQKPWWCLTHSQDMIQHRLCRKLTREWYRIRADMEASWGRSEKGPHDNDIDHFFGYCSKSGEKGYQPIKEPYGQPVAVE